MPVRNIWSLHPGECIIAEEIVKKTGFKEVFFPLHDVGVDLLVVEGRKHVGVQVKESRYYSNRRWRNGHVGSSWHQVHKKKFVKSRSKVDFYVFLTYLPLFGEHKISSFQNKFLIVPTEELEKRMCIKDPGKKEIFSFCFHFEKNGVWDERVTTTLENELTNYTQFLGAWHLVKQELTHVALNGTP